MSAADEAGVDVDGAGVAVASDAAADEAGSAAYEGCEGSGVVRVGGAAAGVSPGPLHETASTDRIITTIAGHGKKAINTLKISKLQPLFYFFDARGEFFRGSYVRGRKRQIKLRSPGFTAFVFGYKVKMDMRVGVAESRVVYFPRLKGFVQSFRSARHVAGKSL